jgi:ABC-type Na+ efflux pump permease subunit
VLLAAADDSAFAAALEASPALQVYRYGSREQVVRLLSEGGDLEEVGVVAPPGIDAALAAGETPVLEGLTLYYAREADLARLGGAVEAAATEAAGAPVRLRFSEQRVDFTPQSDGGNVLPAVGLVLAVLVVGMMVPTHLMIEEKLNKTLEVLMVSPATAWHVVLGKAATGLAYALALAAVAVALNAAVVVHGWLAALAILAGALFSVALGLLLGSALESRQQVMLWGSLIIAPGMIPILLTLISGLAPEGVVQALRWLPTVALFDALRASFARGATVADWGRPLAIVLSCALGLLAATAAVIRRSDR